MSKIDRSQMDFKKTLDMSELKKSLSRLEFASAAAMVLFFFFPIVSFGPFSVNGFGAATSGGWSFLLFLIPLMSLMIIAMRPICQIDQVFKIIKLVTGALPIAFLLYGLIKAGGDVFKFLGMGSYLMVIAGVLIILGTLNIIQLPNAVDEGCEATPEAETKED